MGVQRSGFVARETSFKRYERNKKKTLISISKLSYMGALCVCYSGNCLMSSMIGDQEWQIEVVVLDAVSLYFSEREQLSKY